MHTTRYRIYQLLSAYPILLSYLSTILCYINCIFILLYSYYIHIILILYCENTNINYISLILTCKSYHIPYHTLSFLRLTYILCKLDYWYLSMKILLRSRKWLGNYSNLLYQSVSLDTLFYFRVFLRISN